MHARHRCFEAQLHMKLIHILSYDNSKCRIIILDTIDILKMQFCSLPVGNPIKGKLDKGVKFTSRLNPVTLTDVVSPITYDRTIISI